MCICMYHIISRMYDTLKVTEHYGNFFGIYIYIVFLESLYSSNFYRYPSSRRFFGVFILTRNFSFRVKGTLHTQPTASAQAAAFNQSIGAAQETNSHDNRCVYRHTRAVTRRPSIFYFEGQTWARTRCELHGRAPLSYSTVNLGENTPGDPVQFSVSQFRHMSQRRSLHSGTIEQKK